MADIRAAAVAEIPFDLTDDDARRVAADWCVERGRGAEAKVLRAGSGKFSNPFFALSRWTLQSIGFAIRRQEIQESITVRDVLDWFGRDPQAYRAAYRRLYLFEVDDRIGSLRDLSNVVGCLCGHRLEEATGVPFLKAAWLTWEDDSPTADLRELAGAMGLGHLPILTPGAPTGYGYGEDHGDDVRRNATDWL
jgi:hypothetical protein